MAFRMMRDIGMHVALRTLGDLAQQFFDEDVALRQQIS